jgi:hypothetical protein
MYWRRARSFEIAAELDESSLTQMLMYSDEDELNAQGEALQSAVQNWVGIPICCWSRTIWESLPCAGASWRNPRGRRGSYTGCALSHRAGRESRPKMPLAALVSPRTCEGFGDHSNARPGRVAGTLPGRVAPSDGLSGHGDSGGRQRQQGSAYTLKFLRNTRSRCWRFQANSTGRR